MTRDTLDMFDRNSDRGRFGDNETTATETSKQTEIELAMSILVDRPQAVLVSRMGDFRFAMWLPKSQVKIDDVGPPERNNNGVTVQRCRITIPVWLAEEKGLT